MVVHAQDPVIYRHESTPKHKKAFKGQRDWRQFRCRRLKCSCRRTKGGWHLYLNEDLPRDDRGQFVCAIPQTQCTDCGHGYAALAGAKNRRCDECLWDAFISRAAMLALETGHTFGLGMGPRNTSVSNKDAERYGLHQMRRR